MKGHLYFIFNRKELIYIGQSRRVLARLYHHLTYHRFTAVRVIECDVDKLRHYEKRLIAYFKPRCNKCDNPSKEMKLSPMPWRRGKDRIKLSYFKGLKKLLVQEKVNPL